MAKKGQKKGGSSNATIAVNKRARFDYFIEQNVQAGLALEGWEVKSLRSGKGQISEAYVVIQNNEAWLVGALITPLSTASTHVHANPQRPRKLLMHRKQLDQWIGNVERKGYTLVPLDLHWEKGRAKLNVGLARGKKQHDKRATQKDRDWTRQKQRILKSG
ncbi:MAG: SsrA-binding protein SmpB [Pseudomonadota bacterium]